MTKLFAPNRQRVLKQAMAWFVELQADHCDAQRRQRFELWLSEDESHRWAYQEAETLWANMDNLKFSNVPGLESARKARPGAALGPVLAVLVIGAVMTGWWQDYTAETVDVTTAIGERRGIDLVDGSHIELNAVSRLSVQVSWLRRRIELEEGEAQFTVAHEALRPFTVQAGELQVRDVGTVFTVRKRRQDVSVAVVAGEVAVSDRHGWFADSLTAGYRRSLGSNGRLQLTEAANIEQAGGWIQGVLVFDHTPLAVAAAELERHHAVQFLFVNPALSSQKLSGSFDIDDIDGFLKALEKMLPVKVKRDEKNIVLSQR